MPNDTLTLALDGDVPFDSFAEAVSRFNLLVGALADTTGAREGVQWLLDDLSISSAITTIRGESAAPHRVETVVEAYAEVGRALRTGEPIPYTQRVQTHADALRRLIDGGVTAIRFETAQHDIVVSERDRTRIPVDIPPAYGAVQGRIQTLTNRRTLRFTLFDTRYDRAVSCYLEEGQEELMRESWGRRAIVEGLVTREPRTDRPYSIRRISDIELLREEGGDYLDARGIIQVPDGAPPPEEIIRRLRDG